jgi:hypothetical protein
MADGGGKKRKEKSGMRKGAMRNGECDGILQRRWGAEGRRVLTAARGARRWRGLWEENLDEQGGGEGLRDREEEHPSNEAGFQFDQVNAEVGGGGAAEDG